MSPLRTLATSCVRLGRSRGFSSTEAVVLLSAVSLMGAVARPVVADYVNQTRLVRTSRDTQAIAVALLRFTDDVARQLPDGLGWTSYDVLVGSGQPPALGGSGDARWVATDPRRAGSLTGHLVTNAPGYPSPVRALGPRAGWRGPYIEGQVGPDPWGRRYAVNVRSLVLGGGRDTLVVSAGPNGLIETAFDGDGLVAGGDDIVALVSSGG